VQGNGFVQQTILDFVAAHSLLEASKLTVNTSLMGEGAIDSIILLKLVLFLEETFGIAIAPDEVLPESFETVALLTSYVQRKLRVLDLPGSATRLYAIAPPDGG
jgi:acyl carrier protein